MYGYIKDVYAEKCPTEPSYPPQTVPFERSNHKKMTDAARDAVSPQRCNVVVRYVQKAMLRKNIILEVSLFAGVVLFFSLLLSIDRRLRVIARQGQYTFSY